MRLRLGALLLAGKPSNKIPYILLIRWLQTQISIDELLSLLGKHIVSSN